MAFQATVLFIVAFGQVTLVLTEDESPVNLMWSSGKSSRIKQLQFSAFGKNYDLSLEPSAIQTENFQLFAAKMAKDGEFVLEEKHTAPDSNTAADGVLYSISDAHGSLHVSNVGNSGKIVEGILDDIRLDSFLQKDGTIGYKALRLKKQKYNHKDIAVEDFVIVNKPKFYSIASSRKGRRNPDIVYVEVLVMLDYANAAMFKFNAQAIKKYFGIFWNSVDRRYHMTKNPKVQFVISAALYIESVAAQPFVQQNIIKEENVESTKLLRDLRKWLYANRKRIPKFDLAILHTRLDLSSQVNERLRTGTIGLAYFKSVCVIDDKHTSMYNCGVIEDKVPMYTGVLTAAHEVGHILGVPHDGEDDATGCKEEDGFIMSPTTPNDGNAWTFSNCSLHIMKQHILSKASCVLDKPKPRLPLLPYLPGYRMSVIDICQQLFGRDSSPMPQKPDEVCGRLWCNVKHKRKSEGPPPEGTICARNKICKHGKCF